MATRRQIREAFYSHLETAVNGLVPPENIGQEEPESDVDYPAVVHRDDYRKVPLNDGSSAPTELVRNDAGEVEKEVYSSYHEASFGVAIRDHDEQRKEGIYEAIRSYFEKYEKRPWPESDIQSDCEWVNVRESNSEDNTDSSPTVRGDRLIIRLGFSRKHEHNVDPTRSVNRSVN